MLNGTVIKENGTLKLLASFINIPKFPTVHYVRDHYVDIVTIKKENVFDKVHVRIRYIPKW